MRNDKSLQDLVKGCYGRKILYTDVETITADNIVNVVGDCIGNFYYNKTIIEYLWRYYKGDQPVLYRVKVQNADITNKIVENHAYEIVQFRSWSRHMASQYSLSVEKMMMKLIGQWMR